MSSEITQGATILVRLPNTPIDEKRTRPALVLSVGTLVATCLVFLDPEADADLIEKGESVASYKEVATSPGDSVGDWQPLASAVGPRAEVHELIDELIDQAIGEGVDLPDALGDVGDFLDALLNWNVIVGGPAGFALEALDGPAFDLSIKALAAMFEPKDGAERKKRKKAAKTRKARRQKKAEARRKERTAKRKAREEAKAEKKANA